MKRTRTWFGHFLVEHYRRWNKISVEKHLLCAGVFAIRRSVFEDPGMFDETFLFSGDVAFADAIKKRSLAIEHVKDFTVFESARRSFRDVLIHFFRYGLGYSFYAKKNNIGFLNFFGYMAYKAGAGCFHILKGSLGFLMNGCKPRKSILKHVWQGGVDLVYSAGLLTGGLRYGWRGQYKRGAAYI